MTDWCNVLLVLLSQLALWVNNLWSWILQNAGEALPAWWKRQPAAIKILVLGGVTVLLGAGAWALGTLVFACSGFPTVATAAFMIVSALAGLFIGGKRWEAAKADRVQVELERAQAEVLEVGQKAQALEYQLEQMRQRQPAAPSVGAPT